MKPFFTHKISKHCYQTDFGNFTAFKPHELTNSVITCKIRLNYSL